MKLSKSSRAFHVWKRRGSTLTKTASSKLHHLDKSATMGKAPMSMKTHVYNDTSVFLSEGQGPFWSGDLPKLCWRCPVSPPSCFATHK
mmetsp:Transcript_7850/g.15793  ORF Transcript_7850/g.15793 Transcript_7850/m.15793 type:complete len:88 (+) Transcript_7850:1396-1659(+)